MDPYLESPRLWPGVHSHLIVLLNRALNENLPAGFLAGVEERCYVLETERHIRPDVAVIRPRLSPAPPGGIAVREAVTADPPHVLRLEGETVRESFIEIIAVNAPGRVVAVIEILSPANKTIDSGREAYQRKQRDVLASETHLLEIDLLRAGMHTVAVPDWAVHAEHGAWNYLICLHRAKRGAEYEYWPLTLRDRLPRVGVPLTGDAPEVIVDLQTVFANACDFGLLSARVDYEDAPEPPLSSEDAAWADARIRDKRQR